MLEPNQPRRAASGAGDRLRIVYLGMTGRFSIPPLEALLKRGYEIAGVVVPTATGARGVQGPDIVELKPKPAFSSLPMLNPYVSRTIKEIAWEHDIAVFEARRLKSSATQALLEALRPDVGCVACFARRVPPALLELPHYGFLNVHPSLLPDYRGPAPLFWALRDGAETGVTIHAMDAGLDTGDILAQTTIRLPDGIDADRADHILASVGGELLIDVLHRLPHGTILRQPQSSTGVPAPWPQAGDFELHPEWSTRRAYNFMRATSEWGQPYPIRIDDEQLVLGSAIGFTPDEELPVPFQRQGHTARLQFADGVLDATIFERITLS